MLENVISLVLCYLLGMIPSGAIVGKVYGVDLKTKGSGNIGATNVARTIGKKAGITTLIVDILKGALAIILISSISSVDNSYLIGWGALSAVAGHCLSFPPLKGGKGVATTLGVFLALSWKVAIVGIVAFGATVYLSRIVSLSSLVSAAVIGAFVGMTPALYTYRLPLILLLALVVFRHHENIKRLWKGEEKKFSAKS